MERNADTFISVSTVVENDVDIIEEFIEETTQVLSQAFRYYELVIIDNDSQDGTAQRIQAVQRRIPNVRQLRLSRRYRQEIALVAALDNSIGDYVVIMNVNHDPPSDIPKLVDEAMAGKHIIIGRRVDGRESSLIKKLIRKGYHILHKRLLGYSLHAFDSYFRVYSRQVVNSLTAIRSKHRTFRYFSAIVGFGWKYIPYEGISRKHNSVAEQSALDFALSAVDYLISNSAFPLRFVSLLGMLASVLNLLYLGYVFVVALTKEQITGEWITTSVTNASMFFVLFLLLAVLSEYIAHILEETKDYPLYFIEYETSSSAKSNAAVKRLNVM